MMSGVKRQRTPAAAEWGGERPERPEARHGAFDLWPNLDPVSPARGRGPDAAMAYRAFRDPRLAAAPASLFPGAAVLDIGCGAGYASIECATRGAQSVLGVDIDMDLIGKARMLLRYCRAAPLAYAGARSDAGAFLPVSILTCQRWRAPPPLPHTAHAQPGGTASGLARVRFLCQDFIGSGWTAAPASFDVALCFNVTKYVHLGGGDEAVRALFFRVHEALRPGGHLLLIAQAWPSYAKSRLGCLAFAAQLPRIRLRPAHFLEFLIEEVGFKLDAALRTPRPTSSGTVPLLILRKV